MESNKRNLLIFLLLVLLCACAVKMQNQDCPSSPDTNLTCYNDYSRNITCVWNSAHEHIDADCTLHAKKMGNVEYNASCKLESVDARSVQKKCSLYFNKDGRFQFIHELSITLGCNHVKNILTIPYKPVCHIKLNPPGKPVVNFTTVSWPPQIKPHARLNSYACQLQWKKWDQSWSDPSVRRKHNQCKEKCEAELEPDLLTQGETYEARVQVKTTQWTGATWSDWGPTASWVSPVGKPKPPPSGVFGGVVGISIIGAVFALCLAVKLLGNEKVTWVYKKITGSSIPNPGESFLKAANFQNWMSPHFASELAHSSLIRGEIVSVEVTSTVDAVTPCKKEAAMLENMISKNNYDSTSSSFSNPSYSHLCASPPVSSLHKDNLQFCPLDTPNVSVGSQGDRKTAEEAREDESKKKLEIQQLLSKDNNNNNSEPVQVVSDYERVERPPPERFRLQSLDSGMCSGEEVSQESLEADSFSATDGHDEELGDMEQKREERTEKVDFKKLFGGSGSVFGNGSIQICSDYEKVPRLNPGSPELSSLDSGVCSRGEEQTSHEEIQEDFEKSTESTSFQFPPPLSSTLPCPSLPFPQLPLKFSEIDFSPVLQSPSHLLDRIALMTMFRSMEPVDDGYMPVKQEQS